MSWFDIHFNAIGWLLQTEPCQRGSVQLLYWQRKQSSWAPARTAGCTEDSTIRREAVTRCHLVVYSRCASLRLIGGWLGDISC
jgi:hypothetical protein